MKIQSTIVLLIALIAITWFKPAHGFIASTVNFRLVVVKSLLKFDFHLI